MAHRCAMLMGTMDVRDWCQDLRKRKNIRVLCNDWTALQIEVSKLVEAAEAKHQSTIDELQCFHAQEVMSAEARGERNAQASPMNEEKIKAALAVEDA